MNLRVANLVLDGRFGGPQHQILQIAEGLRRHRIETVVIMPTKASEAFHSKLVERDIPFQRLNLHRLTKHWPHLVGYILFFLPEVFSIYRFLKREGIELLHCNCSWQVKGIIAGKMARAKVIWHLQETKIPVLVKVLFNMLAPFCCDGFITAGNSVKKYLLNSERLRAKKVTEIQAPVDTSYFKPKPITKDKSVQNDSDIKVTTVGNINPDKGLEYFIEMANILNSKFNNLSFYIVGSHLDSQRHYSRKLMQMTNKYNLKNLHFYKNRYDVREILETSDVYVCSSLREASPMSVWEAMAMGKAIVSTDVGDVGVYIEDGRNGFIVQSRDSAALAEKVTTIIENETLRKKFGMLSRARAVRELDVQICVDTLKSFYLEVLGM